MGNMTHRGPPNSTWPTWPILDFLLFHAGIGDLFPAMSQGTPTAVVHLGAQGPRAAPGAHVNLHVWLTMALWTDSFCFNYAIYALSSNWLRDKIDKIDKIDNYIYCIYCTYTVHILLHIIQLQRENEHPLLQMAPLQNFPAMKRCHSRRPRGPP